MNVRITPRVAPQRTDLYSGIAGPLTSDGLFLILRSRDLARLAGVSHGVISRAEDSDYGNLTFNTVLRIAAGLDVAFVGRLVPFAELARWFDNLSEKSVQVPTFDEEDRQAVQSSRETPNGR